MNSPQQDENAIGRQQKPPAYADISVISRNYDAELPSFAQAVENEKKQSRLQK